MAPAAYEWTQTSIPGFQAWAPSEVLPTTVNFFTTIFSVESSISCWSISPVGQSAASDQPRRRLRGLDNVGPPVGRTCQLLAHSTVRRDGWITFHALIVGIMGTALSAAAASDVDLVLKSRTLAGITRLCKREFAGMRRLSTGPVLRRTKITTGSLDSASFQRWRPLLSTADAAEFTNSWASVLRHPGRAGRAIWASTTLGFLRGEPIDSSY